MASCREVQQHQVGALEATSSPARLSRESQFEVCVANISVTAAAIDVRRRQLSVVKHWQLPPAVTPWLWEITFPCNKVNLGDARLSATRFLFWWVVLMNRYSATRLLACSCWWKSDGCTGLDLIVKGLGSPSRTCWTVTDVKEFRNKLEIPKKMNEVSLNWAECGMETGRNESAAIKDGWFNMPCIVHDGLKLPAFLLTSCSH